MTNRQHRTTLRPEHNSSLKIAGALPGALRELPMPNGTQADLANALWIAEIEPARRWQTGIAQALEYWDQALRSPRPYLILIDDGTNTTDKQRARIYRLCQSLGLVMWVWDDKTDRFQIGGPASLPNAPDFSPLLAWTGQPWNAGAEALRSCTTTRQPYRAWLDIYKQRQANCRQLQPRQGA